MLLIGLFPPFSTFLFLLYSHCSFFFTPQIFLYCILDLLFNKRQPNLEEPELDPEPFELDPPEPFNLYPESLVIYPAPLDIHLEPLDDGFEPFDVETEPYLEQFEPTPVFELIPRPAQVLALLPSNSIAASSAVALVVAFVAVVVFFGSNSTSP
ncbi:MAG: hypothetical protein J3R72DRAFT_100454 [Linnemannia gamsii]|nr:MAG: hypothetical protein J3R72DRAFT_100454 [Linnemannia gamsii]